MHERVLGITDHEMQIKTSMRSFTSVRMVIAMKTKVNSASRDMRKAEPQCTLVGMQLSAAIMEVSLEVSPSNPKYHMTQLSRFQVYSRKNQIIQIKNQSRFLLYE